MGKKYFAWSFDFGTKESNWDKFRRICETVARHNDVIACSTKEALQRHEENRRRN